MAIKYYLPPIGCDYDLERQFARAVAVKCPFLTPVERLSWWEDVEAALRPRGAFHAFWVRSCPRLLRLKYNLFEVFVRGSYTKSEARRARLVKIYKCLYRAYKMEIENTKENEK